MTPFSAIDLSQLPAPAVVEPLDVERIVNDMLADLRSKLPDYTNTLESDPVYKLLEVAAYREWLLRARINDAGRAVMLAYARGANLDNLAALYGIDRQTVVPADESVIPPIPAVMEDDDRFRLRMQLSVEGHTTAGPVGSYLYHTFSADERVKDATVESPAPGEVVITILSTEGDGIPSNEVIAKVMDTVTAQSVRPLTDQVTVQVPTLQRYPVVAELVVYRGPDRELIRHAALQNLQAYLNEEKRLGHDVVRSGIFAALHIEGVQRVKVVEPAENRVIEPNEVAVAESINLIVREYDHAC